MTKEELLKKIDFEKSWLYDCGIFGSDVDIAFHAIKKSVIEALEQEPKTDRVEYGRVEYGTDGNAYRLTISNGKEFEQEPCEDAVSRKAVIDEINEWIKSGEYGYTNATYYLRKRIDNLQSVNPQKIGHWIPDVDKWGDIVTTVNGYRCDKCNTFNADKDNYCPNCGAKMVESQENEVKE